MSTLYGKNISDLALITLHGELKNPVYFHVITGELCRLVLYNKSGLYKIHNPYWVEINTLRSGYVSYSVNSKFFAAHRGIFHAVHGYLPDCIDHIDENRRNNAPANLQPLTVAQNVRKGQQKFKQSKLPPGVMFDKTTNMYRVQVRFNTELVNCGRYTDLENAVRVANYFHGLLEVHRTVNNLPAIDEPWIRCARFNQKFKKGCQKEL